MSRGSSPLARGLRSHGHCRIAGDGIIPARAGFTGPVSPLGPVSPDHPRSRGVYFLNIDLMVIAEGSSPLARGLLSGRDDDSFRRRIIPARAGFTGRPPQRRPPSGDHPRSRGVYSHTLEMRVQRVGSSPLARGLLRLCQEKVPVGGIIPARAGFTEYGTRVVRSFPDHPRSRGVYDGLRVALNSASGSSPLARGLHATGPLRRDYRRDHPRSRGVYRWSGHTSPRGAGSSPLARGLPRGGRPDRHGHGIIPARAGFTFQAGAWNA